MNWVHGYHIGSDEEEDTRTLVIRHTTDIWAQRAIKLVKDLEGAGYRQDSRPESSFELLLKTRKEILSLLRPRNKVVFLASAGAVAHTHHSQ
jgi:hypothetical protein